MVIIHFPQDVSHPRVLVFTGTQTLHESMQKARSSDAVHLLGSDADCVPVPVHKAACLHLQKQFLLKPSTAVRRAAQPTVQRAGAGRVYEN